MFLAVFVPLIPANWYLASTSFFGRISDLPEYYAASWLILNGHGADIYVLEKIAAAENTLFPSMAGRVVPLFMSPPITVLIAPLALIPVEICHYIWCALLVASIAGAVFVLGKLWNLSLEERLVLWIFLSTFGPVFESIRIAQIAPFMLLALSCSLYFLAKEPLTRSVPASPHASATDAEPADPSSPASTADAEPSDPSSPTPAADAEPTTAYSPKRAASTFAAACFLALLSCKPQILIPILVALAGAGRYKVLSQTIGLIVALALASLLLITPSGWANYQALLSACVNDMAIMHADQNPTVRGQLLRFFLGAAPLVSSLTGGVYLLALGVIFWINRRFRKGVEAGSKRNKAGLNGNRAGSNGNKAGSNGNEEGSNGNEDWLLVVVLTLALGLVCSQYLMTYDVLMLIPAIAVFAKRKLYGRFSPLIFVPAVFIGIVYMLPFYSYIHYGWLLKGEVLNPFFVALLYFAILLAATPFVVAPLASSLATPLGVTPLDVTPFPTGNTEELPTDD